MSSRILSAPVLAAGAGVLLALLLGLALFVRDEPSNAGRPGGPSVSEEGPPPLRPDGLEVAIFAGGCFWCMEPPFEALPGVREVISGYTGGHKLDPTYEEVSAGGTGHAEAIQVLFDPVQVSYAQLLDVFWRNIDPLERDGQFCDKGHQYRTAIFYRGDAQRQLAQQSRERLDSSGRFDQPIQTEIEAASAFYPAEDYHQDYYKKNPVRYKFYRYSCGRDRRLAELWGLPADKATAAHDAEDVEEHDAGQDPTAEHP